MTTPDHLDPNRHPIRDAFSSVGKAVGWLGSVVTSLVGWGIVTATQGDALLGLLGAIPGAVTAVTTVLVAFGVIKRAERKTTPLSDPRDNSGTRLVPAPRTPLDA